MNGKCISHPKRDSLGLLYVGVTELLPFRRDCMLAPAVTSESY